MQQSYIKVTYRIMIYGIIVSGTIELDIIDSVRGKILI